MFFFVFFRLLWHRREGLKRTNRGLDATPEENARHGGVAHAARVDGADAGLVPKGAFVGGLADGGDDAAKCALGQLSRGKLGHAGSVLARGAGGDPAGAVGTGGAVVVDDGAVVVVVVAGSSAVAVGTDVLGVVVVADGLRRLRRLGIRGVLGEGRSQACESSHGNSELHCGLGLVWVFSFLFGGLVFGGWRKSGRMRGPGKDGTGLLSI